jgi:hypothetical protein
MKRSVIFKIIAVINFIALFTIFVLYRNGSFDSYFYKNSNNNFTSPNGGVGAKQITDSINRRIDSLHRSQRMRLSSSKSIVAIDNGIPRLDSTRVRPTDKEKEMMQSKKTEMMQRQRTEMMYSSKS